MIAGHGRRIKALRQYVDRWYAGVSVKYFQRYSTVTNFTFQEAIDGPEALDAFDADAARTGVGIDVGTLWEINPEFDVALVAQDLITLGDVTPDMSLNLGLRYALLQRLNLVADYRDLLDSSGDPIPMHLHMGGELDLTLLRLRGGLYQGYPTAGVGINLWLIKLDVVYYARERGEKLGYAPEDNVAVELQIGLD